MSASNTYSFRPKAWAVLLTLLLTAVMVKAGVWQYGRGVQKLAMQAQRLQVASTAAVALLADVSLPPQGALRHVFVEGVYAPELTVQLDNQSHQQNPGVHAWTPLLLSSGQRLIVDRGWLPLAAVVTPPPSGTQRLEGNWRSLPAPGMRLGRRPQGCAEPRPVRVNYPDLVQMRCLFGASTLDGLLELSATIPGGFVRDWASAGANEIPASRHFTYAAQWWLFAITLVALSIKINLKKITRYD